MRIGLVLVALVACRHSPLFDGLDTKPRSTTIRDPLITTELANGLRVALLPDHRTNLVTVDVRYEVGAADDPAGKSGLAHLTEHVLWDAAYRGSEPLRDAALDSNASTSLDRTLFWEIALDREIDHVLEIEAKRMETACADLDDKEVARERDVVIEEVKTRSRWSSRQLDAAIWGSHPYSRSPGGTEIKDATAADLCRFVEAHYTPSNATLVVTGRFDGTLIDRIRKRFETIPRRRPAPRVPIPPEVEPGSVELSIDGLEHPTALMVLPAPPLGSLDDIAATLAARLIALKMSRVPRAWTRIVGDERARAIVVAVEVIDPKDVVHMERGLRKLFADFGHWNVDGGRLFMRDQFALEFDDLYSRGAQIASNVARGGFSRFRPLALIDNLQREQIKSWLDASRARVVRLYPAGGDRSHGLRELVGALHALEPRRDAAPALAFPEVKRVTRSVDQFSLSNGLRVVLARDPDTPAIDIRLVFPVGTDQDGDRAGRAFAAAWLLEDGYAGYEGTRALDHVRWYHQHVATRVAPEVGAASTTFAISGLALYADWHLWKLAWTMIGGKYQLPEDGVSSPEREPRTPSVLEVIDERLGGSRRRIDWSRLGARELEAFRRAAYRPDGATLIVSGRFDAAQMRADIAKRFGVWRATGSALPRGPTPIAMPSVPSNVAIDDPDGLQVLIAIAFAPSRSDRELSTRVARAIASEILSDRLRSIREGLGVSYGVNASYQRAIRIVGAVEPAYASAAAASIKAELARVAAGEIADDFARARNRLLARALAQPIGAVNLGEELAEAVQRGGIAHRDDIIEALRAIRIDDAIAVIKGDLRDARRIVVVQGPKAALDPVLAALGADRNVERLSVKVPAVDADHRTR